MFLHIHQMIQNHKLIYYNHKKYGQYINAKSLKFFRLIIQQNLLLYFYIQILKILDIQSWLNLSRTIKIKQKKAINSIIKFSDSLNKYNLFIFGIPLFKKYNNLFDYDNKSIGFKGDGIYDLTNAYNIWLQKNNIVKGAKEVINNKTENNGNVNYKEQIAKIFGIIIGVSIIVCVLYHQYRRRNGKLHSKLIEEKNGNQMNNQIINDA